VQPIQALALLARIADLCRRISHVGVGRPGSLDGYGTVFSNSSLADGGTTSGPYMFPLPDGRASG